MRSNNPWINLPERPPFVLPEDEPIIVEFNVRAKGDFRLHIESFLPEPFVGNPTAPVVLLSNNPGIGKRSGFRQQPEFMEKVRAGISLEFSNYPFIYLDPKYRTESRWWRQKLKRLIQRFGDEVVSRSICNIVFFPYPSKRFRHGRLKLPSQEYCFQLVRDAVNRRAVIVLMRRGQLRRWQHDVSELSGYHNLILLRNPQMPSISPKNCESGDYEKVVCAIEESENADSGSPVLPKP